MASSRAVVGTAAEARAWIAAAKLPAPDRAALVRFVDRFPSLAFYRETDATIARHERAAGLGFPAWFKAIRGALAGVHGTPGRVRIWFRGFGVDDSPREDVAHELAYTLAPPQYGSDERRRLLGEACTALPIAIDARGGRSTLCIGLDRSNKTEIYDCCEEDLRDNEAAGRSPDASFYRAFDTYRSMLHHIVAVEVDGTRISARSPATAPARSRSRSSRPSRAPVPRRPR